MPKNDPVEAVMDAFGEFKNASDEKWNAMQGQIDSIEKVTNRAGLGGEPKAKHESLSAIVMKDADIDKLRSNSAKSVCVAVKGFDLGQKNAVITTTGLHGVPQRDGEIYGPIGRRYAVRDLLIIRPTTASSIEYLKGTRTGTAAIQGAEGDVKSEIALSWELVSSTVRTVAVWIPASRQALDDVEMLKDYVDLELRDALQLEEDKQLLKGPGTGTNLSGLWTQAVAYNRAVTGDSPSDTIRRAITQVQLARGVVNGIVINPVGLELLELDKDLEGRYLMSYTVTDSDGRTTSWRVPVVVTDAMAADEFLVGDFSRAARLYDRQTATVEISTQHADFFTRNLVAILAEERLALTVPRPDMLVKGTLTAP